MGKPTEYLPITELLEDIVDNRGKSVPTSTEGTPLIATNCIKHSSIYPTFEKVRYVDDETLKTWFRAHLQPNDILFVNKGTPGRVCLVPDPVNFCAAQDMIGFRCNKKKINYKYLFAALRSSEIQKKIENFHVGLVIPHFRKQDLPSLMIPMRSPEEQEAIGNLYITLSEKIELNARINAELESMAKTLYDYWFVQFAPSLPPPNTTGDRPSYLGEVPAIAGGGGGGGLVWNEALKREIPLGWEVGTLEQIVKIRNGFAFKSEDYQETGRLIIRTKNFDNNTIDLNDVVYISEEKAKEYSDFELSKFDFLLVMVGASVGKSVITPSYILPALQNQNMWNFLPKNEKHKIYTNFLISRIVEEQAQSANGSARDFFRKDHFYGLKVAIPQSSIIEEFQEITMPIFEKIDVLISESQTLTKLRDWLLPMLMNGQVKV